MRKKKAVYPSIRIWVSTYDKVKKIKDETSMSIPLLMEQAVKALVAKKKATGSWM